MEGTRSPKRKSAGDYEVRSGRAVPQFTRHVGLALLSSCSRSNRREAVKESAALPDGKVWPLQSWTGLPALSVRRFAGAAGPNHEVTTYDFDRVMEGRWLMTG